MSDITTEQLVEYLDGCNSRDLMDLITQLEDTLGVKAPSYIPSVLPPTTPDATVSEQTEFDVMVTAFDNKIAAIKEVRKLTGLGLKEAKEALETLPAMVREAVSEDDAKAAKEALEAIGATVELR